MRSKRIRCYVEHSIIVGVNCCSHFQAVAQTIQCFIEKPPHRLPPALAGGSATNVSHHMQHDARLGCALRTTGVDCRLRQSAQGVLNAAAPM